MVSRSITIKSIDDKEVYVEYKGIKEPRTICKIDVDSNKVDIIEPSNKIINNLVLDTMIQVVTLLIEKMDADGDIEV